MLARLIFGALLLAGALITSMELSANARARAVARRPPPVADEAPGRYPAASVPNAPEVDDDAPPAPSPALTY